MSRLSMAKVTKRCAAPFGIAVLLLCGFMFTLGVIFPESLPASVGLWLPVLDGAGGVP